MNTRLMTHNTEMTSSSRRSAADRMRLHRERRRKGLRCVIVELRETEVDALIRKGMLNADARNNSRAVRKALYAHLDQTLGSMVRHQAAAFRKAANNDAAVLPNGDGGHGGCIRLNARQLALGGNALVRFVRALDSILVFTALMRHSLSNLIRTVGAWYISYLRNHANAQARSCGIR
jgi:hypothetical protein